MRHKKVIPPNKMALISAPAKAEFQCQRTRAGERDEDFAGDVVGAGEVGAGEVGEGEVGEGEGGMTVCSSYSTVLRAMVSWPNVVKT
ncbi:MAG: hypothetical protein IT328_10050 [Caldilineaceae bacterium]|nr:hypothetical protein [Caldilineaceae bacterium]